MNGLSLPICAHGMATVTADALNVRAGPSTSNRILGKFVAGQVVTVWTAEGDWWLVQDLTRENGAAGWCAAKYLQANGELTP